MSLGEKVYPAKILLRIPSLDVMILQINASDREFPYSDLIDCSKYPLGLSIFSIGYPNPDHQGFYPKLTKSYLAADRGMMGNKNEFQITADEGSGCSGAGIFNNSGEVIGVLVSMFDHPTGGDDFPEDVSFAVKSGRFFEYVKDRLPKSTTVKTCRTANQIIARATESSVIIMSCQK